MTNRDHSHFKEMLVRMRERVNATINRISEDTLKGDPGETTSMRLHMADMASETFDLEMAGGLAENEEGLLNRIDLALEKIDKGDYGVCGDCGRKIPLPRLEALPFAEFCIECQTRIEKDGQRKAGLRPDFRETAEEEA